MGLKGVLYFVHTLQKESSTMDVILFMEKTGVYKLICDKIGQTERTNFLKNMWCGCIPRKRGR